MKKKLKEKISVNNYYGYPSNGQELHLEEVNSYDTNNFKRIQKPSKNIKRLKIKINYDQKSNKHDIHTSLETSKEEKDKINIIDNLLLFDFNIENNNENFSILLNNEEFYIVNLDDLNDFKYFMLKNKKRYLKINPSENQKIYSIEKEKINKRQDILKIKSGDLKNVNKNKKFENKLQKNIELFKNKDKHKSKDKIDIKNLSDFEKHEEELIDNINYNEDFKNQTPEIKTIIKAINKKKKCIENTYIAGHTETRCRYYFNLPKKYGGYYFFKNQEKEENKYYQEKSLTQILEKKAKIELNYKNFEGEDKSFIFHFKILSYNFNSNSREFVLLFEDQKFLKDIINKT